MKNKPNFFFDNRGFPNWGGQSGGLPLGGFPHIIPFFSDRVPKFHFGHTGLETPKTLNTFIFGHCARGTWGLL